VSWFPAPTDDLSDDYVPIDSADIQVGTRLFSVVEITGTVFDIVPGSAGVSWTYFLEVELPDGSLVVEAASMVNDPADAPNPWWQRWRVVRRIDKPLPWGFSEAPDHSAWVYPATDGRVVCYRPADTDPVYARGDQLFRGQWTLDPRDIWTSDDAVWDWLPVNTGSDVAVGDVIMFSKAYSVDVDEITVDASNPAFTRTTYLNASVPIGWVDQLDPGAVPGGYRWGFMERVALPAADSLWQSEDGAKWIYAGDVPVFVVVVGGDRYHRGESLRRAQIVGGLTEWNP
jgi:hypothetical protein